MGDAHPGEPGVVGSIDAAVELHEEAFGHPWGAVQVVDAPAERL
jgi:hypothetical protein